MDECKRHRVSRCRPCGWNGARYARAERAADSSGSEYQSGTYTFDGGNSNYGYTDSSSSSGGSSDSGC